MLAATSIAHADPHDTRERAISADIVPLAREQLGFRWQADVLAAAIATTGDDRKPGGLATVAAQVAITGVDCDVAAVGGQITARTDERVVSGEQSASVCPLGGDGWLAIDHRLEWDVAPRLLAAPRMRPGLQRRETLGLEIVGAPRQINKHPLSLIPRPVDEYIGGPIRIEGGVGWTNEPGPNEVGVTFDINLARFRRHYADGPPGELGLGALRMDIMILSITGPGDPVAATLGGKLAHVEGLRIGGGFRIGARLGGRFVGIADGHMDGHRSKTYLIGEGALSLERDVVRGLVLRLAGERRSWPAWDARYVVDDRATLSLAGGTRVRTRLEAFAARETLLELTADREVPLVGAVVTAELDLHRNLVLRARSELGRSVYVPGATLDQPRWASESLLVLAARAGSRL